MENELKGQDLIDHVEFLATMAVEEMAEKYHLVDCPLKHRITPGLYSREIQMPANILVVSQTHKKEHQFVVLDGVVSVWTEENGWEILQAGHVGITKAGTRRILKMETAVRWITFHSTLLQTVEEIEDDIIVKRVNQLLGGRLKENVLVEGDSIKKIN